MSKHTPGPWIWSAGLSIWKESDSTIIASVACDHVFAPSETELANAQLIAAAPDLLAALQRMDLKEYAGYSDEYKETLAFARAAIAKATGGQP